MTDTLITPEFEYFPNRKRWTVQECYRLIEAGNLTGRWELIDGEILSKMGQKPPHSVTLGLIGQWLTALVGYLYVRIQSPLTILGRDGKTNEPEPDITVTTEPTIAYTNHHPSAQDVRLLVEVADTSRRFDLTTKARLYARAGIREYWVVDLIKRQLHCHRQPTLTGYTEVMVYGEAETIALLDYPNNPIRFGDLLPPPAPTG